MTHTERFTPGWESLQTYRCPDWFRDAKFGIWAHWGPQAVPMAGDWYARNMYIENHPQHQHHVRTYGHPSRYGYKDIVRLWRAERFDPVRLVDLYKRCGARYFVSCAVHHDNFDCWNSTHHRWNSVEIGPHQDIVGLWARAARQAGLRFGVTEHLERSWSWFNTNKGADTTGPWAGLPYDGADPTYADFYFPPHPDTSYRYPANPPEAWVRQWQARITDLIDRYDPDLLYTDGSVPFGEAGREVIAHYYNRNIERRGGQLEAVYTLKEWHGDPSHGEYREGIGVLDIERGVVDAVRDQPWQIDTCVGGWFYDTRRVYKAPGDLIHTLVDAVSKNGNMLLNFPPRPDGTLDEQEEWIAREIGKWLEVNGEAIYATRPWHTFGEGPTRLVSGAFAETERVAFTDADLRFTTRGNALYAISMAWPADGEMLITSLANADVSAVRLLGSDEPLTWSVTGEGLRIRVPRARPCEYAFSYEIALGSQTSE